jgi:hypothetical protein
MIWLLLTYLLFQIAFDHWAIDSVLWNVIYFTFQYGWVAALAIFSFLKTKQLVYLCFGIIFTGLTVDELLGLWIKPSTYEMMISGKPVFILTVCSIILFFTYEIIKKWKKLSN